MAALDLVEQGERNIQDRDVAWWRQPFRLDPVEVDHGGEPGVRNGTGADQPDPARLDEAPDRGGAFCHEPAAPASQRGPVIRDQRGASGQKADGKGRLARTRCSGNQKSAALESHARGVQRLPCGRGIGAHGSDRKADHETRTKRF